MTILLERKFLSVVSYIAAGSRSLNGLLRSRLRTSLLTARIGSAETAALLTAETALGCAKLLLAAETTLLTAKATLGSTKATLLRSAIAATLTILGSAEAALLGCAITTHLAAHLAAHLSVIRRDAPSVETVEEDHATLGIGPLATLDVEVYDNLLTNLELVNEARAHVSQLKEHIVRILGARI